MILTFKSNKRGNVTLESLTVIILLFVFIIGAVIVSLLTSEVENFIVEDEALSDSEKAMVTNMTSSTPQFLDSVFIFAMVALMIAMIISSLFIDTHPIFFIISLILLVAVLIVAAVISNTWSDFASDGDLSSYADKFPMSGFVMNNLVEVIVVFAMIIALVLYLKLR